MAGRTTFAVFIGILASTSALQSPSWGGQKPQGNDAETQRTPEVTAAVDDDLDPFKAVRDAARVATGQERSSRNRQSRSGPYTQTLANLGDAQYTGIINVGGQKLKAVIDTGSFELVVLSTNCSVCGQSRHLYDNAKSADYEGSDFENEEAYGSGTTYSREAHDKMSIGTLPAIERQFFWEVHDANMPLLMEDSFAAIFGVGPPQSALKFALEDQKAVHDELEEYIKEHKEPSASMYETVKHYDAIVEHAKTATSVASNIGLQNMSVCFGKKSGSSGYYTWNDTVVGDSHEKFTDLDVVGDIYWSATLTGVRVGQAHLPATATQEMQNAVAAKAGGKSVAAKGGGKGSKGKGKVVTSAKGKVAQWLTSFQAAFSEFAPQLLTEPSGVRIPSKGKGNLFFSGQGEDLAESAGKRKGGSRGGRRQRQRGGRAESAKRRKAELDKRNDRHVKNDRKMFRRKMQEDPLKVWVAGFPNQTPKETVAEHFSLIGTPRVHMMKQGRALLAFQTSDEAETALATLNGSELNGKKIKVTEWADKPVECQLSYRARRHELSKLCKRGFLGAHLKKKKKNKGAGGVKKREIKARGKVYSEAWDALNLLDDSCKVKVKNLPKGLDDDGVKEHFAAHGTACQHVYMMIKTIGGAVVGFDAADEAELAISAVNGSEIDGQTIEVMPLPKKDS